MSMRRNAIEAFRCIVSKAKVGVGVYFKLKRGWKVKRWLKENLKLGKDFEKKNDL